MGCSHPETGFQRDELYRKLAAWDARHGSENWQGRTDKYVQARRALVELENAFDFDARVRLSQDEAQVNQIMQTLREQEMKGYSDGANAFPASDYFCLGKNAIQRSAIFDILRKMPKGGALHLHSTAAGSSAWIVTNATVRPHCYVKWSASNTNEIGRLKFFCPGEAEAEFVPVRPLRDSNPHFNEQLLDLLTLGPEDVIARDPWQEFNNYFLRVGDLINFRPVFIDYFTDAFRRLLADGVQYVELRTGLGPLYDLECEGGQKNTPKDPDEDYVRQFRMIRNSVRQEFPEFDLKLILAFGRFGDPTNNWGQVERAIKLRRANPDFVIGFDLVGHEDVGGSTLDYLTDWMKLERLASRSGTNLPFYFHDGESAWASNENLYDAVLLGSKRIGHAFNLFRYPALEFLILQRGIALEVCPISNQMLGYVRDLRVHPASGYLNRGIPCVLSSDDAGVLGTEGLSHDFWVAFMAWELDLTALKQMALNSIHYSGMAPHEKLAAQALWQRKWDQFIQWVRREYPGARVDAQPAPIRRGVSVFPTRRALPPPMPPLARASPLPRASPERPR